MAPKKLLAELFGTFGLTLVVLLSLNGAFPIPTPILAGLTLGLFVYTLGNISGTHLNPAVTVGLWSVGKIVAREAARYMVSQIAGAFLALIVMKLSGSEVLGLRWDAFNFVFLGETLGTMFFTFGIAAVVLGKVTSTLEGVIIGSSLFLGASIASMVGAPGFLNPAVALGTNSINVATLVGPLVGSLLGMQFYKYIASK